MTLTWQCMAAVPRRENLKAVRGKSNLFPVFPQVSEPPLTEVQPCRKRHQRPASGERVSTQNLLTLASRNANYELDVVDPGGAWRLVHLSCYTTHELWTLPYKATSLPLNQWVLDWWSTYRLWAFPCYLCFYLYFFTFTHNNFRSIQLVVSLSGCQIRENHFRLLDVALLDLLSFSNFCLRVTLNPWGHQGDILQILL